MSDEKQMHPTPPKDARGFYVAPVLYPKFMRKIADLIEALTALEERDPERTENSHYAGHAELPIYDDGEGAVDPDAEPVVVGWACQYDTECWVFVQNVRPVGTTEGDTE